MASDRDPSAKRGRALAQLQRDGALARLSVARKWMLAAAAAIAAGLSALVSAVAPGHTLSSKTRPRALTVTPRHKTVSPQMPPLASAAELGLQGPAQAPQPAPAPTPQVAPTPQAPPSPAPSAPDPSSAGSSAGSGGGAVVSGGS